MMYNTIEDLPESIQYVLSRSAREVYRRIYNLVWQESQNMGPRCSVLSPEALAHKVAWWAIVNNVALSARLTKESDAA
jgi:cation transport regulator ChaB